MDEVANDNLTKPDASGYRPGYSGALNPVSPGNAPPHVAEQGFNVLCERCNAPYRIQRLRPDRANRRLCVKCRGIEGRSSVKPPFTPESLKADRIRAAGLINKRVKLGKVLRPAACQHCNRTARTDGHHPDYSQPDLIVFLCRSCHMKAHRSRLFEAAVAAKASSTGAVDLRYANRKTAEVEPSHA